MNFKKSPFSIQGKGAKEVDNGKNYPTIADLMKEQKVSKNYPTIADLMKEQKVSKNYPTIADLMKEQKVLNNKSNSVHHRRDLDSLG